MDKMLDRTSPLPLYYQLSSILSEKIKNNEYTVGNPLPTEDELMREFKVSRTTVREALRRLEDYGLLIKKQGIGSFVAEPKIAEILPRLTSFSEHMRTRGVPIRTEVLEVNLIPAHSPAMEVLGVNQGDPILRVSRRRFCDGKPLVLSTSYLLESISQFEDFSTSIFEILENKYQLKILGGEAAIEAAVASKFEAKLLEISAGDPVLKISWTTFTESNKCIEFSENTYRGDSYSYIVHLKR